MKSFDQKTSLDDGGEEEEEEEVEGEGANEGRKGKLGREKRSLIDISFC